MYEEDVKFRSDSDKLLFLVECGESPPATLEPQWSPSEELKSIFIKRRGNIVGHLKSFRRSQATKGQWRNNRYKLMKGITGFHKSTYGKRFHRNMGRFLSLKDFGRTSLLAKGREENIVLPFPPLFSFEERGTFLKCLSSIKTHLYVESEYYAPLSEQVESDLLLEEVLNAFDRIERSVILFKDVYFDDIDLLIHTVEPGSIYLALSEQQKQTYKDVCYYMDKAKEIVRTEYQVESEDNGYSVLTLSVYRDLTSSL